MKRINVKPLTHWAIYKGYKLRFHSRTPERVDGVLTSAEGVAIDFTYAPATLTLQIGDEGIHINDYGWELERWRVPKGTP
jgi:hypothetical protein